MLRFFVVFVSLLVILRAEKVFYELDNAESLFEEFIKNFNKEYSSDEVKHSRFNIFKENLKRINEKNTKSSTAEYGITHFTDLTSEEFQRDYTGLKMQLPLREAYCKDSSIKFTDPAPESLDWRKKNVVTDVKNQGSCGSCWAFSTTGNLEGQNAIKHKKLVPLSEQQLVDCDKDDDNCYGGSMMKAMKWLSENGGSIAENDYPYKAKENICTADNSKAVVKVVGCNIYINKTEDQLKDILANVGPLSIAVAARSFKDYHQGIHHCHSNDTHVNHGMLLVGYGKEGDKPYWIVKNSWGEVFGEKGYMRLAMYQNACNLLDFIVSGIIE